MPTVYIETTIPSYLAARLSNYMIVAAQQIITRDWWDTAQLNYDLYISEAVLEECRAGDPKIADKRVKLVGNLPILAINDEIVSLALVYHNILVIPEK